MKTFNDKNPLGITLSAFVLCLTQPAFAFDSGSTGADGVFNPTVDTVLNVPEPDGIFNFTSVDIPLGVTVTFARNTTNAPVTILSSGDVIIDGTLSVAGGDSPDVGTAGDSNLADDGLPGLGGPGGFNGGTGGELGANVNGSDGQGPGGGQASLNRDHRDGAFGCGGGGGGFSTTGLSGDRGNVFNNCGDNNSAFGGPTYGTSRLSPLVGGSGGGGASSGTLSRGSGGGGGGGALLIAATGTVNINGVLTALGGNSGDSNGVSVGGTGGSGSGGSIRIVATEIIGIGSIDVNPGNVGTATAGDRNQRVGGVGGNGRIRLESASNTFSGAILPPDNPEVFSLGSTPGDVFVAGMPSLSITSIAGQNAPALPAGNLEPANADITLPVSINNPVTVEFATSGVPVDGTTAVELTVLPEFTDAITATSTPLVGNETAATASASVTIPDGVSVLQASLSFTLTVAMGEAFSPFAEGEQVAKVKLSINPEGQSETTFITISGKEFIWPSNAIAMN